MEELESKFYAVLMRQYPVGEKKYLLTPIDLIEGKPCEQSGFQYFRESNGNEYCYANSDLPFDEATCVVNFLISKQHLQKKYKELSLEEAKEKRFNIYKDKTYFSFVNEGKVAIMPIRNPFSNVLPDRKEKIDYTVKNGSQLNNVYGAIQNKMKEVTKYSEIEEMIQNFQSILLNLNHKVTDDIAKDCINYLIEIYQEFLEEMNQLQSEDNDLKAIKYLTISKLRSTERMIKTLAKDYDDISKNDSILEIGKYNKYGTLDVVGMRKYLDENVIGQEQAKIDAISVITSNELVDSPYDKMSCFLIGPTGSGKTLIATAISEYLDIPMKIYNTTGLTSSGYVGKSIDDIMIGLLANANGDLEKAQKGIVVLDELDKKASKKANDPAYSGVLNELLPFVEGSTYTIKYKDKEYSFDTSWLNIFATGSFASLVESRNTELYKKTKIGFTKTDDNAPDYDIDYPKLSKEDLHDAGIPMELLGRMPVITQLEGHTKETLKELLTDSKRSPLLAKKNALKKLEISVFWTEGYLDAIAEKSLKEKTGGRSLAATVEMSIKMASYTAQEYLGRYTGILLTEKAVEDNLETILIDSYGNHYTTREVREERTKKIATSKQTSKQYVKKLNA